MIRALSLGLVAAIGAYGPELAHAAFIDTATESPTGVVFSGIGTFNLNAAPIISSIFTGGAGVLPSNGTLTQDGGGLKYAFKGPTDFGSGNSTSATSQSGDYFGFLASAFIQGENFFLPSTYVSGTPLNTSLTFAGATFASLGVNPGTYVYTYGSGADIDTITLQIGPVAPLPEPASLVMLAMGAAGIVMARRR